MAIKFIKDHTFRVTGFAPDNNTVTYIGFANDKADMISLAEAQGINVRTVEKIKDEDAFGQAEKEIGDRPQIGTFGGGEGSRTTDKTPLAQLGKDPSVGAADQVRESKRKFVLLGKTREGKRFRYQFPEAVTREVAEFEAQELFDDKGIVVNRIVDPRDTLLKRFSGGILKTAKQMARGAASAIPGVGLLLEARDERRKAQEFKAKMDGGGGTAAKADPVMDDDIDGDGVPDVVDDSDGDGIPDVVDSEPSDVPAISPVSDDGDVPTGGSLGSVFDLIEVSRNGFETVVDALLDEILPPILSIDSKLDNVLDAMPTPTELAEERRESKRKSRRDSKKGAGSSSDADKSDDGDSEGGGVMGEIGDTIGDVVGGALGRYVGGAAGAAGAGISSAVGSSLAFLGTSVGAASVGAIAATVLGGAAIGAVAGTLIYDNIVSPMMDRAFERNLADLNRRATTPPTEQAETESGERAFIYLKPIDPDDPTKGTEEVFINESEMNQLLVEGKALKDEFRSVTVSSEKDESGRSIGAGAFDDRTIVSGEKVGLSLAERVQQEDPSARAFYSRVVTPLRILESRMESIALRYKKATPDDPDQEGNPGGLKPQLKQDFMALAKEYKEVVDNAAKDGLLKKQLGAQRHTNEIENLKKTSFYRMGKSVREGPLGEGGVLLMSNVAGEGGFGTVFGPSAITEALEATAQGIGEGANFEQGRFSVDNFAQISANPQASISDTVIKTSTEVIEGNSQGGNVTGTNNQVGMVANNNATLNNMNNVEVIGGSTHPTSPSYRAASDGNKSRGELF